uniref:Uncharacterized protein n=1 Tax=Magallana gigas TaxID=29159 RepID=K1RTG2_MAGGI
MLFIVCAAIGPESCITIDIIWFLIFIIIICSIVKGIIFLPCCVTTPRISGRVPTAVFIRDIGIGRTTIESVLQDAVWQRWGILTTMGGWGGFLLMLMRLFGLGFPAFVGREKSVPGLPCSPRKGAIANRFGFWTASIAGLFGAPPAPLGRALGFGFELVTLWIPLPLPEGLMIGSMPIKP